MPGRRYGFGECYFECNKDQAEELLDKQKEDTMKEIAVLNGELNSIHETLATLKTQLCAARCVPRVSATRACSHRHPPRPNATVSHPTTDCTCRYGRFGNNINLEENPEKKD